MIPVDTELTEEQFNGIHAIIKERQKELKKLRYGDISMSIWLMEQLEHIKKIRDYNAPRFA